MTFRGGSRRVLAVQARFPHKALNYIEKALLAQTHACFQNFIFYQPLTQ